MDHSFRARLPPAPPEPVGLLQSGQRHVLKGRALELSLPLVQCTSIQVDREDSLCFKVPTNLCSSDKFRLPDVSLGRGKKKPLVMV